jgi:hypothetical protein
VAADELDGRGLVDEGELDGVGADGAGAQVVVGARRRGGVEALDEVASVTSASFWISIRPATSASMALSAATIFARWRSSSASESAPRQSIVPEGPQGPLLPDDVVSIVLKELRTLKLATFSVPPTGSGALVRGFVGVKT